jgi:hypothetical protein
MPATEGLAPTAHLEIYCRAFRNPLEAFLVTRIYGSGEEIAYFLIQLCLCERFG